MDAGAVPVVTCLAAALVGSVVRPAGDRTPWPAAATGPDGSLLDPAPSLAVRNHSPAGFS